jgi:alcohol dehydrogenase class IV
MTRDEHSTGLKEKGTDGLGKAIHCRALRTGKETGMFMNRPITSNIGKRIDDYRFPSGMLFGNQTIKQVGANALRIALNRKAAVVTDQVLEDIGLCQEVRENLQASGFTVDAIASEATEPTLSQVVELADRIAAGGYGIIVGFGGGSSMDRAKIASCFAGIGQEIVDYVAPASRQLPDNVRLPKLLIPTTSGTGSEVSNTAVVIVPEETLGSTKTWITGNNMFADCAIIDPELTKKLPPRLTASSGLDALSHCAEGVLSLQANAYSDALALQAIRLIAQNLRVAYTAGEGDADARWNMALAAMIGGQVISFGWVSGPATLGHVASEGLSSSLSLSHGDACALLLPYVYWYNLSDEYAQEKIARIAEAMGIDLQGMPRKQAAISAIVETFRLIEELAAPTSLKDCGMKASDIPTISTYILTRAEAMYSMSAFNPVAATFENIKEFFTVAHEGKEALLGRLS